MAVRDTIRSVCTRARSQAGWNLIQRFAVTTVEYVLLGVVDEMEPEVSTMLERVKKVIKLALPLLKAGAALTPTTIDDEVVKFLESWVNTAAGTTLEQHEAHLKAVGALPQ